MQSADELRQDIQNKAAADPEFRARLLADPKGAIEAALGVTIPAGLSVKVHEEDTLSAHLVLPPASKLDSADLEAVSGGTSVWYEVFGVNW